MLKLLLCSLLIFLPYVYGGTKCPPRKDIQPCICINSKIGKSKYETYVVCVGLPSSNTFLNLESTFMSMEVNRFYLHSSFWTNDLKLTQGESNTPMNFLSTFKMDDIEMIDTSISSFGCPQENNCRTSFVKRFTAINSTLPEKLSCDKNALTVASWVGCPTLLEELTIERGVAGDMTLRTDFFPMIMPKLKTLRLPNNQISRIDRRTFNSNRFPQLELLDLSHNSLRDVKQAFIMMSQLKYLDLSHNSLRTIVELINFPQLKVLNLANNQITVLVQSEWQHLPSKMHEVDFMDNQINCACATTIFVNSTLPIHMNLKGVCDSPAEVRGQKIRKASRFLSQRCNQFGEIAAHPITSTHKPT